MPDVENLEEAQKKVDFGFDKEGYLRVKIHLSHGLWNILGALVEAQTRVMAYFGQIAAIEEAKKNKLVRPNDNLESFKNKWH